MRFFPFFSFFSTSMSIAFVSVMHTDRIHLSHYHTIEHFDIHTSGTCNATSLAHSCVTIPEAEGIDLVKVPNVWGYISQTPAEGVVGSYFCVRRAAKAWKDYSITSKATDCADSEVFCGTFCFDKKEIDGKCPVESFDIVQNAALSKGVTVNRLSSSATTASGANSTATPVVNVVLGRGRPCYGHNGGEGMGYPKQSFSAIPNLKEADNGWTDKGQCSYKNTGTTEESKATGVDTRYQESARFDQWSLYAANGVAANGVETKVGVVGTDTNYTMYNPYLAVNSGATNVNAGDASMWMLATRGGLYWKPECAADATKQRGDVTENKDPITQLVNLHYWLMFTQGFFGLFIVGIVLGITTLYSMHSPNQDCPCVNGEGGLELQRISKFKTICGTISNVIKVPVLLFCVSVTGAAGSIFARFNGCAGDEISNRSFESISEMIMAADAADTRALYIDLATLLYTLIMSVMAWRKGCKPNYAIMRQPPEGWDDDQKKDVELGNE